MIGNSPSDDVVPPLPTCVNIIIIIINGAAPIHVRLVWHFDGPPRIISKRD